MSEDAKYKFIISVYDSTGPSTMKDPMIDFFILESYSPIRINVTTVEKELSKREYPRDLVTWSAERYTLFRHIMARLKIL